MKKFYFICGFPRSGNTLLTSILNQNPNIFSTGLSSLPDIFYRLILMTGDSESYLTCPSRNNLHNLFTDIFNSYYKDQKEEYIIERSNWITPFSYPLVNDYCPNKVKIILLVRSIKDIVKSYLNICRKSPGFYINQEYNKLDHTTLYKSEIEEKINIIFRKGDWIDQTLYSIKWLIDNNHTKNIRFLDYDDIVNDSQKAIKSLYEYYDIPTFQHNFNDMKQVIEYGIEYSDMTYLKADLHTIRTNSIGKVENDICLPDYIIEKCDRLEIWKGKIKNLI
jgi:hypothetical protein